MFSFRRWVQILCRRQPHTTINWTSLQTRAYSKSRSVELDLNAKTIPKTKRSNEDSLKDTTDDVDYLSLIDQKQDKSNARRLRDIYYYPDPESSVIGDSIIPVLRHFGYADDIRKPQTRTVPLGSTSPEKRRNRPQRRLDTWLKSKEVANAAYERIDFRRNEGVKVTKADDPFYEMELKPDIEMSRQEARKRNSRLVRAERKLNLRKKTNPFKLSLAGITAEYILKTKSLSEVTQYRTKYSVVFRLQPTDDLEPVLSTPIIDYLNQRGYTVKDVVSWADVLASKDARETLHKLKKLMEKTNYKAPRFLLTHLLLREEGMYHMEIRTLIEILETYFKHDRMRYEELRNIANSEQGTVMDSLTSTLIIIRLARLTHRYAPSCLPAVFKFYIDWIQKYYNSASARTSLLSNYLLHAISSVPPVPNPHALHLQFIMTAQYDLLESMSKLNPPILLTRKGFRGLVRTRLASEKTPSEKEHVSKMSTAWPPWPAVHDGWNEKRNVDLDDEPAWTTSAGQIMAEMEKAGYALQYWEEGAKVLAGVDTTKTPTIPTRTFYNASESEGTAEHLWAARVRATRTLTEAWDIVSAYQRSSVLERLENTGSDNGSKVPPRKLRLIVYKELFRKILHVHNNSPEETTSNIKERDIVTTKQSTSGFLAKLKLALRGPDTPEYQPSESPSQDVPQRLYTHNTIIRGPLSPTRLPNPPDPFWTTSGDSLEVGVHSAQHPTNPPSLIDVWIIMAQDEVKPDIKLLAEIIEHTKSVKEVTEVLHKYVFSSRVGDSELGSSGSSMMGLNDLETENMSKRDYWLTIWGKPYGNAKNDRTKARNPRPQRYLHAFIKSLASLDWPHKLIYLPHTMQLLKMYQPTKVMPYKAVLRCLASLPHWENFGMYQYFHPFSDSKKSKYETEMEPLQVRGRSDAHRLVWYIYNLASANKNFEIDLEIAHILIYAAIRDFAFQENKFESIAQTDLLEDNLSAYGIDRKIEIQSYWDGESPTARVISIFEKLIDMTEADFIPGDTPTRAVLPPNNIPRSNTIHQYVRLLSLTGFDRYQPLLRIFRWMVRNQDYLEVKQCRLALVATRYFLDEEHGPKTFDDLKNEHTTRSGLKKKRLDQINELLDKGFQDWGGAPTLEEANAYAGVFGTGKVDEH